MTDWVGRFERSLRRICALDRLRKILVGVSGGPDSTALLRLIVELRGRLGGPFPEILVGHVHHGMRGQDADDDEAFVRELADRVGIECVVARGDVTREAQARRLSPEAAARFVRHRAFRAWTRDRSLDGILLGHHLMDQAETVLFRAVRGAGIRGLGGMSPARRWRIGGRQVWILRPLLDWPPACLLRYLEESGQPYRHDSTNVDESIPRNRIRHAVLPLLEESVQAGAVESLARLGELARRVGRDLRELGSRAFGDVCTAVSPGEVRVSVDRLRSWPPSVAREALARALDAVGVVASGDTEGEVEPATWRRSDRVGRRRWATLLSWTDPRGPHTGRLQVGARETTEPSVRIELRYGEIRFRAEPTPLPEPAREVPLESSAPVEWGSWRIEARELPGPDAGGALLPAVCDDAFAEGAVLQEQVDADRVRRSGSLHVRSRRRGDRLHPLGAPGQKTLKELFRERRVWPCDRDGVPLVVAGRSIVWVVGHRIDEEFRVRDSTGARLVLTAVHRPSAAAGIGDPLQEFL